MRWLSFSVLLLAGCGSIVAPGQTRADLDSSGATRWALTEYDFGGSHFVWIPTWTEGLLGVSTAKASNCKRLSVLEFRGGVLASSEDLGADREAWTEKLKAHGRIKDASTGGGQTGAADPLYVATALQIVPVGVSTECVLFAKGFPLYGQRENPRCHRPRAEIQPDDVLYYLTSRGGMAEEIVLRGGHVVEISEAEHLGKDWSNFYHQILFN